LEKADLQDYVQRYERRLRQFGYSPQTLGWGKKGRQDVRFQVLAQYALRMPESSVLDVGCGFADLYDFLLRHGWHGQYTGTDIVPGLLKVARERHPHLDLRENDLTSNAASLNVYDFVMASGVLNARLKSGNNKEHIRDMLNAMHRHARVAVCADFLSTYVEFQEPRNWHTDPGWVLGVARQVSRRVLLRHDYMPYEFALFIFVDDSVSLHNIFHAFEYTLP
jgi:ubiquinone/menaquinone biosynthesis C-methylase UbiE